MIPPFDKGRLGGISSKFGPASTLQNLSLPLPSTEFTLSEPEGLRACFFKEGKLSSSNFKQHP
jgi:hypothetical protein